jgi:VIT1/CCC1 family predicted Fe2+/Mn2+ transporter
VLGANDGIISTASLVLGVASAAASRNDIMLTGVAGLVAGAMSIAAGENVSVSSQSDTEHADLRPEKRELAEDPVFEGEELAQLYVARDVEARLAREVAKQLMARDALGAHARDELGISEIAPLVRCRRHLHRPLPFPAARRRRFCSSWCRHQTF